jgi:integrase
MASKLIKRGRYYYFYVPKKITDDSGNVSWSKEWVNTNEEGYTDAVTAQGKWYSKRKESGVGILNESWYELKRLFLNNLKARNKTEKSIDSYLYAIKRLESVADMKKATDLSHHSVDELCKKYHKTLKESTLNKDIHCLKKIGSYAVTAHFAISPLLAKYPEYDVPDIVRDRFLLPEELCLFFGRIQSRSIKMLCFLGYYACQRMEECVMTKKEYFIWDKNLLKIPPRKTKRNKAEPDYIPIHADLAAYVKSIIDSVPGEYICTYDDMSLITSHNGTNHVNELFDSCGLTECTHNTLRHSFISHLIMAGVDSEIVKRWARKEDLTPYLHLSPKFNDESINLLPSIYRKK